MSDALDSLYDILAELEHAVGGCRQLSACSSKDGWPDKGLYFFFEPGEVRHDGRSPRVVRVGTHAVSSGSKATLWNRLRTHRGTVARGGNHRGSIFRRHVGDALANREQHLYIETWGQGGSAKKIVREAELQLEQQVSQHLGSMSVLWVAIDDPAGPASDRAYLERNLIGLLSCDGPAVDMPSSSWLGRFSPNQTIQSAGLWNLDHINYGYEKGAVDLLGEYARAMME